ncbi:MAG: hypothetical protein ACRDGW_10115 [Actinomycetota bacterium]|jgi:hypothetical protein
MFWTYLDQMGQEVGRSPQFADAESAEDWIGASWRDLFENGVEEVVLYDQARGKKLYRMGLSSE